MTKKQKVNKRDVYRELWKRGNLDYKRHYSQMTIKNYIKDYNKGKIVTILASRRLGKSFELLLEAVELCNEKPNAIVKYICPKLRMVKQIVGPNMRKIMEDCPENMRPEWKENDKTYIFPNGSEIQFAGTDNGSHENLRGGAADLCIVDEAGFCDHLAYVIRDILRPTILTTGGRIILISTPSKTSDHDFIQNFVQPLRDSGELLVLNIYDNPMLSEEDISELKQEYPGGENDPGYQREYLCEIVRDKDSVVIPEFTPEKEHKIVTVKEKPAYYDSYTSGDVGFRDLTVYLFAYWDFLNATLVIEDELVMNGPEMTTENLANKIKEKEREKLGDINKEAQINQVRMMISNDQIRINPKCKHLIYHIKAASWKPTTQTASKREFARLSDTLDFSVRGGHADALDALIYLVRNIVRSKNPYPKGWNQLSGDDIFHSRMESEDHSDLVTKVKKILNINN
jgi:hypothetical protein